MVAEINRMTNARMEDGIQPIYDDGEVQVWNADARSLPLEDESVQLVVTSPPFNCRIAYDGYDDWLPWNEYWHVLIEPQHARVLSGARPRWPARFEHPQRCPPGREPVRNGTS